MPQKKKQTLSVTAMKTGWCYFCKKEIPPDVPMVLHRDQRPSQRCLPCFLLIYGLKPEDDHPRQWELKPCIHCGRPLYVQVKKWGRWGYVQPVTTACDQYCRNAARAKQRRALRRQSQRCNHCGGEYQPQSSASRFCSPACKQKAYRKRHADSRS